jgi:transcriptional regulator with XRE-family HTH domain
MTENREPQETPSDTVARRVRELRDGRGWSAARLAEECAKAGYPQITGEVIGNIERGRRDEQGRRRREVSVDEVFAFARTFGLSPGFLLAEWFSDRDAAYTFMNELDRLTDQLSRAQDVLRAIGHIPPPPEQEGP